MKKSLVYKKHNQIQNLINLHKAKVNFNKKLYASSIILIFTSIIEGCSLFIILTLAPLNLMKFKLIISIFKS